MSLSPVQNLSFEEMQAVIDVNDDEMNQNSDEPISFEALVRTIIFAATLVSL